MAPLTESSPVPVSQKRAALYEEYKMLSEDVYLYPSKDFLFYQADIRSKELVKQRMEVLEAVIQKEQVTVVTSFDAFMDVLLPRETIRERVIHIKNTDSTGSEGTGRPTGEDWI